MTRLPTLPMFEIGLFPVKRTDINSRLMADDHYSRQTPGAQEFMGNGRTLVLRNTAGTVVFGWLYPKDGLHVIDACWCSIFRKEGAEKLASALILEAEAHALKKWPQLPRFATYIDPAKVHSANPGYCFKIAGYRHVSNSRRDRHLLVKERL